MRFCTDPDGFTYICCSPACQPPSAQMILITPQDVAAVEEAKKMMAQNEGIESIDKRFVHVVQMRPARANASRS